MKIRRGSLGFGGFGPSGLWKRSLTNQTSVVAARPLPVATPDTDFDLSDAGDPR
jgi:hypothetical protein